MFSDDSDIDVEDVRLTINEHYAKAYEYRKEREELAKLKEKYGSDVDEDADEEDSEDAESEDEDGEELTPAVDAAILRTLARIKRKDPSIYEATKDVFEEERKRTGEVQLGSRAPKDKSKPLTIRQHALASALEDASGSRSPSPEPLTYVQEQKQLREDTIAAFKAAVDGGDDDDDFLVPREKTKDEVERDEEEYRAFLEREVGQDLAEIITLEEGAGEADGVDGVDGEGEGEGEEEPQKKMKKSKKGKDAKGKSGKSKQDEDQEFLMNYILNRGWIDKAARRLPTYKEITKKGKAKAGSDSESEDSDDEADDNGEGEGLIDEDEFDEVADAFESSYNFRFEEPNAAEIARFPRNISSLVRPEDTSRKEAREKRKARKEEELLKKREEIKRLKALKLKELRAKLERIGAEGGKIVEESKALQDLDLEADWDPEAHDRQMRELYENDAAGFGDEADEDVDPEKPTWDDDIDITDIIPHGLDSDDENAAGPSDKKKKKKKKKKKGADDDGGMDPGGVDVDEMDADIERAPPAFDDEEEWDGTEEMRKRKLEEYMDEVYGLDFNDMVGGMTTRFHYTKVDSQAFGLTPAEVLVATDAELNTYMGIKKYAPYRKEGKGRTWDAQRGARLKELKDTLKGRGAGGAKAVEQAMDKTKKRKGKKERMREKVAAAGAAGDEAKDGDEGKAGATEHAHKDKKLKRKVREDEADEADESDDAADEAGEASRKKKRRRHRKTAAAVSA